MPIAAFALSLFGLERLFPLRRAKGSLAGRLLINLTFAAVAFVTVALTVRPAADRPFSHQTSRLCFPSRDPSHP